MTYRFRTSIGNWEIRPDAVVGKGFELRFIKPDGDWGRIGHYEHAHMAASDCAAQATGYDDWDSLKLPSAVRSRMEDFSEWTPSAE